jgi:2-haloacid dehalogenase
MSFSRRMLLRQAAAAAAIVTSHAAEADSTQTAPVIRAVAFDGFVIFDPRPITAMSETLFPGQGRELAAAWKTRQFEYTWLRTLMGSYVDFWQVTDEALTFAGEQLGLDITSAKRMRLMDEFINLKAWLDVLPSLTALQQAGIRLAFLNNFSKSMHDANVRSAGLQGFFEEHLSTDQVRAYKPDPRAYRMGLDHFKLPSDQIAFAAFGGWDAAGAKRFGYWSYWCNRLGAPEEVLGANPDATSSGLTELLSGIAGRGVSMVK